MAILIDGYNLLNACGVLPASGEAARDALLNHLSRLLTPAERGDTTVVFDAKQRVPGRPAAMEHAGIQVRFARHDQEADDLIEALIAAASAPRQLIVVSSDRRLQRAARRRRAQAVDSGAWYRQCLRRHQAEHEVSVDPCGKPDEPLGPHDVERWLQVFDLQIPSQSQDRSVPPKRRATPQRRTGQPPPGKKSPRLRTQGELRSSGPREDVSNKGDVPPWSPFPPGYGEDVVEPD